MPTMEEEIIANILEQIVIFSTLTQRFTLKNGSTISTNRKC